MNPKNNLILLKGEDKTESIKSCEYGEGLYKILFQDSSTSYKYKYNDLIWQTKLEEIDLLNFYLIPAESHDSKMVKNDDFDENVHYENDDYVRWRVDENNDLKIFPKKSHQESKQE